MRRLGLVPLVLAVAGGTALLMHQPVSVVQADSAQATWRGQVAPLVFTHCASCHHEGGSGPFALTSYANARRWGPQMADVVQSRYMPPWLPESDSPGSGQIHFEGDRHLQQREIDLLTTWVKAGMPEGTGPEPQPPVYRAGWQMGEPDLVLEMPVPVTLPAAGSDLFINFILPARLTGTHWVRAMEIQPGAGQLVHHANVVLDRTASLRAQHPGDWQKGVPGMDLQIDSGGAFDPDSHFLFWKPDSTALVEPPGMPWRLDSGNDLILNMHLKPTGKPETVRARIGLYFTDRPATAQPMLLQLEHDRALDIPAGDANFVVEDELKLPVAVDVLGVYPHAHYLCREMEGWASLPDGKRQPLFRIPQWDIDRQSVYRLAVPLALPVGTVLHMRYVYDNSTANVHNPNSPPVRVRGGNRAADEMSHLWIQVLPHANGPGDPRYALDRAWMERNLEKSPGDPIALYNLGALAQAAGKPSEAEGYYRRVLAEHADDSRSMTSLGAALEAAGDVDAARAEYKAVLALDPDHTDAAFDLGSLALKQGDPATAETLFRQIAARHPEDLAVQDALGQSLLDQHHATDAGAVFEQVLGRSVTDTAALRGLALVRQEGNQQAGAEALLLRALAVRDEAATRSRLAMLYSDMGDLPLTLEQLRAWATLTPGEAEPHRALAQVLSASGDMAQALAEQRTVVRLSAQDANDWNDLGAMAARAGQRTEARDAFQHCLRMDPSNTAAKRNLDLLNSFTLETGPRLP